MFKDKRIKFIVGGFVVFSLFVAVFLGVSFYLNCTVDGINLALERRDVHVWGEHWINNVPVQIYSKSLDFLDNSVVVEGMNRNYINSFTDFWMLNKNLACQLVGDDAHCGKGSFLVYTERYYINGYYNTNWWFTNGEELYIWNTWRCNY